MLHVLHKYWWLSKKYCYSSLFELNVVLFVFCEWKKITLLDEWRSVARKIKFKETKNVVIQFDELKLLVYLWNGVFFDKSSFLKCLKKVALFSRVFNRSHSTSYIFYLICCKKNVIKINETMSVPLKIPVHDPVNYFTSKGYHYRKLSSKTKWLQ